MGPRGSKSFNKRFMCSHIARLDFALDKDSAYSHNTAVLLELLIEYEEWVGSRNSRTVNNFFI